jgi:pyridoxamine 5'-phosphate oxidase
MEFWKDGANRLHDRVRFTRAADGSWARQRLYP